MFRDGQNANHTSGIGLVLREESRQDLHQSFRSVVKSLILGMFSLASKPTTHGIFFLDACNQDLDHEALFLLTQ